MAELLWWHRPGQRVVCIDDSDWSDGSAGKLRPLVRGDFCIEQEATYTIRSAGIKCGMVLLRLVEDDGPGFWVAARFRPARDTSIDCFRSLLSPTPEDEALFLIELADLVVSDA